MIKHAENLAGYLGKATRAGREVITRIVPPKPFVVLTATAVGETWQGPSDHILAEIMILAGRDNEDAVQISLYEAVSTDNYLDLEAKDSLIFGGLKLSDIHLKFSRVGQQIHLAYSLADGDFEEADTV